MKNISIIIISLLFIGMGCKIHCPEFPANLNYFPYYKGQELRFTNSQQDIQNFIISSKNDSKAYSFAWNCKCDCDINSIFNIYHQKNDYLNIIGGLYIESEIVSSIMVSCNINNSEYLSRILSFEDKKIFYDEIYKYLEDTIIIENENNQIVKKVVIVKGKGLVSYTTADGEEWKLVE